MELICEEKKESTLYLNRIRILAAFMVISIHVSAEFYYDNQINSLPWILSLVFNCMSRTAVPLFVFVSGAIYLNEKRSYTCKKLLWVAFRFVVIFFVWDILYKFLDCFVIKSLPFSWETVRNAFLNLLDYKYHLWYLLSYTALIALVPVIRLICKKENRAQVKYLLMLFVVCSCCVELLCFVVHTIEGTSLLFERLKYVCSLLDMINFGKIYDLIILFISGWYFSTFDFSNRKKTVSVLKWTCGILAPALTVLMCVLTQNKEAFGLITNFYLLFNYVITVSIFLTFRYSKLANTPNAVWDFVADKTFGIYLVHAFILDLSFKVLLKFVSNENDLVYYVPLICLLIFICSLAVVSVLHFIPKRIRKWIC